MDGLDVLFANLPAIGASTGFVFLTVFAMRMLVKADARINDEAARYRQEKKDHEETERALDEERRLRRKVEDELSEVKRKVDALEAQVRYLTAQVAGAP